MGGTALQRQNHNFYRVSVESDNITRDLQGGVRIKQTGASVDDECKMQLAAREVT